MHGEVVEVVPLTPSMVRVVLGGDGLDRFQPTGFSDQYVNALFVPGGAPYDVPFDLEAAREAPPGQRPMGRRYTIRWWRDDARQLAIDFVVHGDTGYAGRWAQRAHVGDLLQFVGPTGAYAPSSTADCHLFVGDESALPAIGASLERLWVGARAIVVAIVDGPAHELALDSPAEVAVQWVHRHDDGGGPASLVDAVGAMELPDGNVDVFVHGEAGEVRAVRRHPLADRMLPLDGASISPYWRRGQTDEAWRQVKSTWLAEVERET